MKRALPILLAVVGCAAPVGAVTDEEIFREFRFNRINPGARALGMGGAFVSLADDATAAQANPAGMGFLRRREYFGELRLVDSRNEAVRFAETLPTIGVDTALISGTEIDDSVGFSFLSAVFPHGRWTLGVSLQSRLDVDNRTLSSFSATTQGAPGVALIEGVGRVDTTVRNANFSFGYRLGDHLAVGGTVTWSRLDVESEVLNTVVDTQPIFAPEPLLLPTLDLRTAIDDTDDDLTFSLGVIYKRPEHWGVGAVIRRAPRFEVDERIDPATDVDGDGNFEGIDLFGTRTRLGTRFDNTFKLPDSVGVGANHLWLDQRLTVALDVEWIRYSNLTDGYVPGVNVLTTQEAVFDVDDGIDVRLGAEYIVFNEGNLLPPMGLRAGVWLESDSTLRAHSTGDPDLTLSTPAAFQSGDDELHGTIGAGFNFRHWKLDVAADLAESDNEFLISVIYRE